jgi:hypothetical protein
MQSGARNKYIICAHIHCCPLMDSKIKERKKLSATMVLLILMIIVVGALLILAILR